MKNALKILLKSLIVVFILLILVIAGLLFVTEGPVRSNQLYGESIVKKSKKTDFIHYNTGYVYDSNNKLLARLSDGEGYGNYILYKDIPKNVINAFIAVEDRTFWINDGYDPEGIVRVMYRYLKSRGEEAHGASTITQQVVRNQFLSTEKTLNRKVNEISIARAMTSKYSKKEIMEFYVNNCYFANGVYGIEMAAKHYFKKSAKDLSLSECAYLCAIPNRPTYYDPREHHENTLKRRNKILKNMLECGFITTQECKKAREEEITIKKKTNFKVYDYQTTFAIDCAIKALMKDDFKFRYHFKSMKDYKRYKKKYDTAYDEAKHKLYTGGYKVYTTLDSNVQNDLQEIVNDEFENKKKDKEGVYKLQAAMTVIDNKTGNVIAVIGGRRQKVLKGEYTYNRSFQSYRQPGSSFKPICVYTPAIMKDYHADTEVKNIDVSVAKHLNKKEDIEELEGETMSLRDAVERSINGVAYSVLNDIGVSYGLEHINKMEFSKVVPDDYNLSASLGGLTYGVNTVEMAGAYSTLMNGGLFRQPTCIKSIKNFKDKECYKPNDSVRVYDNDSCQEMLDILEGVITDGTAKEMHWESPIPVAGKTGTTNDNKDGWFCGLSQYYTATVWVGFDKPKTLEDLYGSTYPAEIWKKSMEYLTKDKEAEMLTEYLPGRDDDEVLSDGYTVRDYRDDRLIGEKIDRIIEDMNDDDLEEDELDGLYEEGKELLDEIISVKYTKEKKEELDKNYHQNK